MSKTIEALLEIITFAGLAFVLVSVWQGSFNIETWDSSQSYSLFGTTFWIAILYYLCIKD